MGGWFSPGVLVLLILSNVSWITGSGIMKRKTKSDQKPGELSLGNDRRRAVTEEEISYIASTLQPRECLSLLHLLNHNYIKRRRKRETAAIEVVRSSKERRKISRSAQITPCETMLLNYWRDPNSRSQRDCFRVSRTLRQVRRDDLAKWLCGRRPSCSARTLASNGTNDVSSLTAQMQVIPIYSVSKTPTDRSSPTATDHSNTLQDSIIWIYIALAVCATAAVLLCIHYLFRRFRKSSQYIALDEKDIRNVQFSCGCMDKGLSLSCDKKRFHSPRSSCGCSRNH